MSDHVDIEKLKLVQHYKKIQEDIKLHKYYMSEKAHHDVGEETATVDWLIHGFGDKFALNHSFMDDISSSK